MVFASAGIPMEGVAIAAGIDRIVDMENHHVNHRRCLLRRGDAKNDERE